MRSLAKKMNDLELAHKMSREIIALNNLHIERLEKQLNLATEALVCIKETGCAIDAEVADNALKEIES